MDDNSLMQRKFIFIQIFGLPTRMLTSRVPKLLKEVGRREKQEGDQEENGKKT